MKCPECGREVSKGSLYCPHCMTEVHWVKDYDTVETQMAKKKMEDPAPLPDDGDDPFEIRDRERFHFPNLLGRRWLLLYAFLGIMCVALLNYRAHTYPQLFNAAERMLTQENFEGALSAVQDALQQVPDSLEGNMLLARVLDRQGDWEDALLVLKPLFAEYPDSIPLYVEMAEILYREGQYDALKELFSDCPSTVFEYCRDYISEAPSASLAEGTYTSAQTVSLSSPEHAVYYTINGFTPDINSFLYEEPFVLTHGTYVIQAVSVNSLGLVSDVSSWKYIIVEETPDPPSVSPEAGIYHVDTQITIEVPDGCKAYYAFDKMPTADGTEYVRPITMPTYSHTFYAILVAANGMVSEPTVVEYYLEY